MKKGPNSTESEGKIDEDPDVEDVEATVEWAMETENVEMIDFVFSESEGPLIQHFGSHIHVTGILDERTEDAKEILEPYVVDPSELEIQEDATMPYLDTIELDADVGEQIEVLERLAEEVYERSLDDLCEIRRSTYSLEDDEEMETTVATCVTCGAEHEVEFIMDAFGAEYYALTGEESGSVGEDAVDMIRQTGNDQWKCKVCFDEK
jgi:hypothetical protein